jgi:HAD superfamily hydrolase (TIGR01509 family)
VNEDGLGAVLFDMDGTLIDSEKVWAVALRELAVVYGGRLSESARIAMVGTNMAESMRILHDDLGEPWRDVATSADWLEVRVAELFRAGLEWRAGARELLAAVRAAGIPTALVTSTGRDLVELALATLGRHNFDVVVTADDVPAHKPDPTPYLAAAAALGVPPHACVAVEDSSTGVTSALAAGCAVVAVPLETDLSHLDTRVVPSLAEVDVAYLRRLVATASTA